jgi:hypothetical protein
MRINLVSRVVAVIGLVLLLVPLAPAGNGPGGTPQGLPGGTGPMLCRVITGDTLAFDITITDEYGTRTVRIGSGRVLCTSIVSMTAIAPSPQPTEVVGANALRCYSLSNLVQKGTPSAPAPDPDVVTDGFVVAEPISVGNPQFLCLPAAVVGPPDS